MADASFILEIIRLVLYGCEFISSITVFSLTADKVLYTYLGKLYCLLNESAKPWNCACIIAFAVIAWLVLTVVIILHCLKYVNKGELPHFVEGCIFAGLTLTWFIIAMLGIRSPSITTHGFWISYASDGKDNSEVIAVRLFSWVNFLMHAASAVVAFLGHFSGLAAAKKPQPVDCSISTAAYGSPPDLYQPGYDAGSPVPYEGQAYQPVDTSYRTVTYVAEGQIPPPPPPPPEEQVVLPVDASNISAAHVVQGQSPQPASVYPAVYGGEAQVPQPANTSYINTAHPEQGHVAQV